MQILHLSYKKITEFKPEPNSVCISILDPGVEINPLPPGYVDILRLRFHDIEIESWDRFTPISREQASQVVKFIDNHKDCNVIAHCHFGQSRSAAVALYVAWRNNIALTSETWAYSEIVWQRLIQAHVRRCFVRLDLKGAWRALMALGEGPQTKHQLQDAA